MSSLQNYDIVFNGMMYQLQLKPIDPKVIKTMQILCDRFMFSPRVYTSDPVKITNITLIGQLFVYCNNIVIVATDRFILIDSRSTVADYKYFFKFEDLLKHLMAFYPELKRPTLNILGYG